MRSVRIAVVLVSACGSPKQIASDAKTGDAPVDAPAVLAVTASPSAFDLHANDTRETLITITNNTGQTSGTPALQVTGLTLGSMTFASNTCTAGLAPGGSCTATGHLTATSVGQVDFQVTAAATPGGTAMATLSATVMPACLATCGPSGATNCCASSIVPGNATGATLAGASFYRSYDVATDNMYPSKAYPATVSDFRLDTYLVTVGRFRAFVTAGMGTQASPPASGAGARTLNGTANQGGWDTSFTASLTTNTTALIAAVKCDPTYQTWTDSAGANESLPMNCIAWYEAMAFCIWDGGYLPTEAEWNYAAAGGSEQRAYPWSPSDSPGSLTIDCSYANYNINVTSGVFCVSGTNRVGSESPKGDGKWGQSDLGGNVYEWMLDWYATNPTTSCNDCANLTGVTGRVFRGGGFDSLLYVLRAALRYIGLPTGHFYNMGVRCARTQ